MVKGKGFATSLLPRFNCRYKLQFFTFTFRCLSLWTMLEHQISYGWSVIVKLNPYPANIGRKLMMGLTFFN